MRNSPASAVVQTLAGQGASIVEAEHAALEAARSPNLSREDIQTMGQSRDPFVRAVIASRADCPLGLLVALADDHSLDVRLAVAGNVHAIPSILEVLAQDKHVAVVRQLATNPALPHPALVNLAAHKDRKVRKTAGAALIARANGAPTSPDHATPELRDRVFEDARTAREQAAGPSVAAPPQY